MICEKIKTNFMVLLSALFIYKTALANCEKVDHAEVLFHEGSVKTSESILLDESNSCSGKAYYYLALISENKNREKDAFNYYLRSADFGYQASMHELSRRYRLGEGVKQNIIKSIYWDRRSKETERKRKVDIAFYSSKNEEEINPIVIWKEKSDHGEALAHYRLARFYDEGLITKQNIKLALVYYEKAAQSGHDESKVRLGYFLCKGIGVRQDKKQADYWLSRSSAQGECL